MLEDTEQELALRSPAAVLAAGIVAAMSFAIVFNTAWNQPDPALASLRGVMRDVVEINVNNTADRRRTTHIIQTGKQPALGGSGTGLLLQVQQGLNELGYFTGTVDGIDGELTRKAVRRFQSRNGLPATGKINRELLDRIRYTKQLVDAAREGPQPDQLVMHVQTGLAELGYRPGAIDGFVGEGTRRAIREFEQHRGLPQTGEVSPRLLAEMKKVSGISKLTNP
jgi:peptidoglycan hydrolase-like protein with peptidoglycan-binding domain